MFERYTEKARRVIFFARYEASQFGSPYIETEHLLLGLLREDKALTNRFLRSHASVESIRKQIEGHTTIREKVSTSVDLPLSNECKRVLAYAAEEAERLSHKHIGTEHLLLGLLRVEGGVAARALGALGLSAERAREEVARIAGPGVAPPTHGQIPFNPRLRRTLDVAMREAMSLGHDEVGTEHLALALLAEDDRIAGEILSRLAEPGVVRDEILGALASPRPEGDGGAAPSADLPPAVTVVLGDDARRLLRRAAGLALADEASEITVEHVRRALDAGGPAPPAAGSVRGSP